MPKDILNMFLDEKRLKQWWNVEQCFVEEKDGGVYVLVWQVGSKSYGFVTTGIIEKYSKDSILVIDKLMSLNPRKGLFGPMRLTLKVTYNEPKKTTNLSLLQEGYQYGEEWDWYYNAVKNVWPELLIKIKELLEE